MSVTSESPEAILRQIDTIMGELQTLRRTVQVLLQAESSPVTSPVQDAKDAKGAEEVSAWDIIQAAPGQRQFRTADDVAYYLREERSTWES